VTGPPSTAPLSTAALSTATPPPRITPELDDDNFELWTSGAAGELRLPHCPACDRWVFPPTLTCPNCVGPAVYRTLSGRGVIYTFTINRQPYHPDVAPPYAIAIVELVEQPGLRFTTNILNCDLDDLAIGQAVRVTFEHHGEVFVPLFEPDPC
jgi:uncharacterized OB-fold protein